MKPEVWKSIVLTAAVMATVPACAQQAGQRQPPQWQERMDGEHPSPALRQERSPQDVEHPEFRHHGRLSPEERRQLRRDIDDAGRELYRPNPQRPPP